MALEELQRGSRGALLAPEQGGDSAVQPRDQPPVVGSLAKAKWS